MITRAQKEANPGTKKPSVKGLARVISAVLESWVRDEKIASSDCKVALNHLVRAFGDLFCHKEQTYCSVSAAAKPDDERIRDHVIPVKTLMRILMRKAEQNPIDLAGDVEKYLLKYSTICIITKDEDSALRSAGVGNDMPDTMVPHHGEFQHIWGRYRHKTDDGRQVNIIQHQGIVPAALLRPRRKIKNGSENNNT